MWSVQVNVLLNKCKQSTMALSFLVGTTVDIFTVYKYQHIFESRLSERSTFPDFFLNKTYMYDMIQAVRESVV